MASVWQEIHCTSSGGGCGGFVLVKLQTAINRRIILVCPKCGHKHERCVKDGQIVEEGRYSGKAEEELCPTIAAWSKIPRTKCMQKMTKGECRHNERDGAVIKSTKDFITPPCDTAQAILRESWTDRFLGKVS